MFDLIFNLAVGGYATIYAASNWNDPAAQFHVGTNFVLAVWCAGDLIKAAVRL